MISYKTEIDPSEIQRIKIAQTVGVCRYVYNFYLRRNSEIYASTGSFISGMSFSKWLNNYYIPEHPEEFWIKEVSSKSVKHTIMCAETAYRRFFKKQSKFPQKKKKNRRDCTMYFVGEVTTVERHRIKIPTLGWIRLKEKAYIPTTGKLLSGTVSKRAGRYYVSVLFKEEKTQKHLIHTESGGIGVDLGIKEFAVVSDGTILSNINKSKRIKKLTKILKHRQRCLSKKLLLKREGEATGPSAKNIDKLVLKIQKIYATITNIRVDYINKGINSLLKSRPKFITMETLNVLGMLKNRHLSKAIAAQNFHLFKSKLTNLCKQLKIELRFVSQWFPSSKLCSVCGNKKTSLKLSDRIYVCAECGFSVNRDLNAAINLKNALVYSVA